MNQLVFLNILILVCYATCAEHTCQEIFPVFGKNPCTDRKNPVTISDVLQGKRCKDITCLPYLASLKVQICIIKREHDYIFQLSGQQNESFSIETFKDNKEYEIHKIASKKNQFTLLLYKGTEAYRQSFNLDDLRKRIKDYGVINDIPIQYLNEASKIAWRPSFYYDEYILLNGTIIINSTYYYHIKDYSRSLEYQDDEDNANTNFGNSLQSNPFCLPWDVLPTIGTSIPPTTVSTTTLQTTPVNNGNERPLWFWTTIALLITIILIIILAIIIAIIYFYKKKRKHVATRPITLVEQSNPFVANQITPIATSILPSNEMANNSISTEPIVSLQPNGMVVPHLSNSHIEQSNGAPQLPNNNSAPPSYDTANNLGIMEPVTWRDLINATRIVQRLMATEPRTDIVEMQPLNSQGSDSVSLGRT